jgi:hypothetical protein
MLAVPLAGLLFLPGPALPGASPPPAAGNGAEAPPQPRTRFLVVGKGRIADPPAQQERGVAAVRMVAEAARTTRPTPLVDAFAENPMTEAQFRSGEAREAVTGTIFRTRLRQLAECARPEDTVVIYTHTHGRKGGFEKTQPLGGIVLDLPVRQTEHGGTILWDEFADLVLRIPARNVIVLTMSCFAGGFVDHLNSPPVVGRWRDRRTKEGRNLIVLVSQNAQLSSDPILKDNELVNPFTYAVAKALEGRADGFALAGGRPDPEARKDGKVTAGELVDFILHTTASTVSESPRHPNTAKPQSTGTFDRNEVLFAPSPDASRPSPAPQPSPADAAKPAPPGHLPPYPPPCG